GPLEPPDLSFIPMLREEVSRLPDHYRLPVVLCYLEGKTNQDAAAQLNCPVGTIKGRLSRARQTLRDRLSRRGLDGDLGPLGATRPAGIRPSGCVRACAPVRAWRGWRRVA